MPLFNANLLVHVQCIVCTDTLKGKGRVSEAMAVAIGRLVKQLLEPMSRSVAPQEIVKRITDGVVASGSRLAEFKEVMFSMLDAYTYEMFVLRTVNKLIAADTHQGHIQKLNMKVRYQILSFNWQILIALYFM